MDCSICDETFVSSIALDAHLNSHKSRSVISVKDTNPISENSRTRRYNINKIFANRFGRSAYKKISNIDNVEEQVHRRYFVEQVKRMVSKHPFVYAPYFIDDVYRGHKTDYLTEKYLIPNYFDLQNAIQNMLDLKVSRYRMRQYNNAWEMNMKNPSWEDKYDVFKNNCVFFADELLELIFGNMLCSYILIIMMDYVKDGIDTDDIISNARRLEKDLDLFKIVDKSLENSIQKYFRKDFEHIVDRVLSNLLDERILERKADEPRLLVGKLSIDKIKDGIINELKINPEIQNDGIIRHNITMKHPNIRLVPSLDIWNVALDELRTEEVIRIESSSRSGTSSLIFLDGRYQKIQQRLQGSDDTPLEFYGRKIAPDEFIEELVKLERGDFEDADNQITRIAGLVLAESMNLRAPHESTPEFDFLIDITDYNFQDGRNHVMKKRNFVINSDIFHCKVMLKDVLTLEKYNRIRHSLPLNEQGIIITFKKPSPEVTQILKHDTAIQVIDEEGLRMWVSITPVIPARKDSVVKIHSDPTSSIKKRIAKVNLIDYEKGIASVFILPEGREVTVSIRTLEEITVYNERPEEFTRITSNYFEFLTRLARHSDLDNFTEAFFDVKVKRYGRSADIKRKNTWDFELENNNVTIDLQESQVNKMFQCSCYHEIDSYIPYTLCRHRILALQRMGRAGDYFDDTWNSGNALSLALDRMSVEKSISLLSVVTENTLGSKAMLLEYLGRVHNLKD